MKSTKSTLRVQAPASAANLGPGLDAMALAINLHNTYTFKKSNKFKIIVTGLGSNTLSTKKDNFVYKAFSALCKKQKDKTPEIEILISNEIPPARGIGSSAAAICSGLLAANAMMGYKLNRTELLQIATEIEGHPDNPAAVLFGGCVVVTNDNGRIYWSRVGIPPQLKVVLFVPDFEVPTIKGRKILPKKISLADAIFNIQRASLLISSLAQSDFEMLKLATRDKLHEEVRINKFFPNGFKLTEAARDAGAKGAFLCGSGSSIGAFAVEKPDYIAIMMQEKAEELGILGTTTIVSLNSTGAVVEELT